MDSNQVLTFSELEIRRNEYRKVLLEARLREGSSDGAAARLRLDASEAEELLNAEPLPDLYGRQMGSLTLRDVRMRTRPQLRQKIAYGRILAVHHLSSQRAIAEYLGMTESYLRDVMEREPPLAALLQDPSSDADTKF